MAYTALLQYKLTCWYYYTIFSTMITMTYTTLLQRSLTWTYYAIGRWQVITMTCIVQLKHTVSRSRVLNLIKRLLNRIDPVPELQNWSERFWHQTPRRQGPKIGSNGVENAVVWARKRWSIVAGRWFISTISTVYSRFFYGCVSYWEV